MADTPAIPSFLIGVGDKVELKTEQRQRSMFRFWLKNNSEAQIIFLSDGNDAPCLFEHQVALKRKGKLDYNNFFTCLKSTIGTCPLCDFADEYDKAWQQAVQLFTILDLTPWVSKKDKKTHPFTKKILCAKRATQEIIMRKYVARKDNKESLRGAQFKVFRGSDEKSPNVGTEFEFIKMVDLSKISPDPKATEVLDVMTLKPNYELIVKVALQLRAYEEGSYANLLAGVAGVGESTDDIAPGVEVEYGT